MISPPTKAQDHPRTAQILARALTRVQPTSALLKSNVLAFFSQRGWDHPPDPVRRHPPVAPLVGGGRHGIRLELDSRPAELTYQARARRPAMWRKERSEAARGERS